VVLASGRVALTSAARGSVALVRFVVRASEIGGTVLTVGATGVKMGVGKDALAASRGAVAVADGTPAVVVAFLGLRREMEVLQAGRKGSVPVWHRQGQSHSVSRSDGMCAESLCSLPQQFNC
jgi:hypothetical protein